MDTPEWLKPGIIGAVVGAVLVGAVGFTWGGWVTGQTADRMAMTMTHDGVIAALVPVCVDMARTDEDRTSKLTTIRAASSRQRRDAVMATGWATVPGAEAPDRDLAEACLTALEL